MSSKGSCIFLHTVFFGVVFVLSLCSYISTFQYAIIITAGSKTTKKSLNNGTATYITTHVKKEMNTCQVPIPGTWKLLTTLPQTSRRSPVGPLILCRIIPLHHSPLLQDWKFSLPY